MSKYNEWCPELEAALADPFPREYHAQKDKKGTFVSVRFYVQRLNELVGPQGWAMLPPIAYHAGEKLGLAVGVSVLGVEKWNVGDEMEDHGEPDDDGKVRDFGSSSTNSWAQGFKRCLAYGFGMGLYLYDKDYTKRYLNERSASTPAPTIREVLGPDVPKAPATSTNNGKATAQQLKAIARFYDTRDISFDDRAQLEVETNSGTMSYGRAAEWIGKLDKLPKVVTR